jgi:mercuric ion binding protein
MKTIQILTLSLIIFGFSGVRAYAQDLASIDIKTSSQCEMCKDRLESNIGLEQGVKTVTLNLETKILSVKYNNKKTSPDKLRLAVSKLGYDADDVAADAVAYEKLPACCKKPVKKTGCGNSCGNHSGCSGH